jgi:hypothetical protein
MVDGLKVLFASQVRIMKYLYLEKLFSINMEENTFLESHLATMHKIYGCSAHLHPATKILSHAMPYKENHSPFMDFWLG